MTDFIEDSALALSAYEKGYDPIEDRLRAMVRHTIEAKDAKAARRMLAIALVLKGLTASPRGPAGAYG